MMDIAEIRKKAQRERNQGEGGMVVPPSPSAAAPPLAVVESEGEIYEELFSAEPLRYPVASPPSLPAVSDPLALILAGRRAALVEDELPADDVEQAQETATALEILCFRVADELYGIDIMELKEIIKPRETTDVPRAPSFIAGVLSLRGLIIPIFILRERLGLPSAESKGKERIIVVKRGDGLCGLLVDEITQVVRIAADTVENPPAVLDGIDREFVSGIGRHDGSIIILLHLDKVLDAALI